MDEYNGNGNLDRARVQDMIQEGIEAHEWVTRECPNGTWELYKVLRGATRECYVGRTFRSYADGRWYTQVYVGRRTIIGDGIPYSSHEDALEDMKKSAAFFHVKAAQALARLGY